MSLGVLAVLSMGITCFDALWGLLSRQRAFFSEQFLPLDKSDTPWTAIAECSEVAASKNYTFAFFISEVNSNEPKFTHKVLKITSKTCILHMIARNC